MTDEQKEGDTTAMVHVPAMSPFTIPKLKEDEVVIMVFDSKPMSIGFLNWLERQIKKVKKKEFIVAIGEGISAVVVKRSQIVIHTKKDVKE